MHLSTITSPWGRILFQKTVPFILLGYEIFIYSVLSPCAIVHGSDEHCDSRMWIWIKRRSICYTDGQKVNWQNVASSARSTVLNDWLVESCLFCRVDLQNIDFWNVNVPNAESQNIDVPKFTARVRVTVVVTIRSNLSERWPCERRLSDTFNHSAVNLPAQTLIQ